MRVTQELALQMHCCGPEGCGRMDAKAAFVAGENRRYCIASKCMAWRWSPPLGTDVALKRREVRIPQGYCGYVGEPAR